MPRIMPIKDLRNTSEISDIAHKEQEPIFITKNGYGDMVLMSMEHFETTRKKWEKYSEIELSEEQIKSGKTKDARESLKELRGRYGL